MNPGMSAADVIAALELAPHPEGGHYRQTWEAPAAPGARPAGTAILFLLADGERSRWHRVDAAECWFWHAGAPLVLSVAETEAGPARDATLGAGLTFQGIVPANHWQAARSTGAWSLVSCTVSPGFRFEGFELAPPGFDIPRGR
jgi:predicted cupin superfamily sugar epimerase